MPGLYRGALGRSQHCHFPTVGLGPSREPENLRIPQPRDETSLPPRGTQMGQGRCFVPGEQAPMNTLSTLRMGSLNPPDHPRR